MSRLREECVANHKGDLFGKVESFLSGEKGESSYADIAAALKMSELAIKVAVHRWRLRKRSPAPKRLTRKLHYLHSVLRD
jgi:hypothetical protein